MYDTHLHPTLEKDHAAAIGYVAAHWASLEDRVGWLVVNILGLQEMPGHAITAELSLLPRMVAVQSLISLTGKAAWIAEWEAITKTVHSLRVQRNAAVHSVWPLGSFNGSALSYRVKAKGTVTVHFDLETQEALHRLSAAILEADRRIALFNVEVITKGGLEAMRLTKPPTKPQPLARLLQEQARGQKLARKQAQRDRQQREKPPR